METNLWKKYRVRFTFITNLCSSVPADPNLVKKWTDARKPRVKAPGSRSIDEVNEEVLASLPETEEPVSGLVFQRDNENGGILVMRAATVRAHMKDCSRVISAYRVGKIEGERSFASKIKNCVYHEEAEYWLPVLRPDGSVCTKADGTKEKAIHVTDSRTGRPMNAIKIFEYVNPARIDFTIKVMALPSTKARGLYETDEDIATAVVSLKDLETLFSYGGTHGYAGERSDGEGRYTFTIEEIKAGKEIRENAKAKKNKAA